MADILPKQMPEYLASRQAARRHDRVLQVTALCIAAAGMVGAGLLLKPMNKIRLEAQMVIDPDTIKDIPVERTIVGGRTVHEA